MAEKPYKRELQYILCTVCICKYIYVNLDIKSSFIYFGPGRARVQPLIVQFCNMQVTRLLSSNEIPVFYKHIILPTLMYRLPVEDMYDINYSSTMVCINEYWKFPITGTFFFGDGVSSTIIKYQIIILNLLRYSRLLPQMTHVLAR